MKGSINRSRFILPASSPGPHAGAARAQGWAIADIISRLTGDLVVMLSDEGRVLAVHGSASPSPPLGTRPAPDEWVQAWVGRFWVDTVSPECRQKARRMLNDLAKAGCADRREISHPAHDGHPVLHAWTGIRLADEGLALALGHDPAPQRFQVERLKAAQDQLEQSYWETRREGGVSGG